MKQKEQLSAQYARLCSELGDIEYKLKCHVETKQAILAKIRQLDLLAGKLQEDAAKSVEAAPVEQVEEKV